MIAPLIIPPRAARRLRRCLPPFARYIIAGTGALVLLGLTLYLSLRGQSRPALITALCIVPIAFAIVSQVLGAGRHGGGGQAA